MSKLTDFLDTDLRVTEVLHGPNGRGCTFNVVPIGEITPYYFLYAVGDLPPHYPVPALRVDCVADLGVRWSQWIDTDALHGCRY